MSTSSPASSEDVPLDFQKLCSLISPGGFLPKILKPKIKKKIPLVLAPTSQGISEKKLSPLVSSTELDVEKKQVLFEARPAGFGAKKARSRSRPNGNGVKKSRTKPPVGGTVRKKSSQFPMNSMSNNAVDPGPPEPNMNSASSSTSAVTTDSNPSSVPDAPNSSTLPKPTYTSLLHQVSATTDTKSSNVVKPETDKDLATQGFILNSSEKNLVSQNSLPVLQNGNLAGSKTPIQNTSETPTLPVITNPNVTNLTICKGGIKNKSETLQGSSLNSRPNSQGSFIRLPVGSMQGKVLQCTSTAVSINSTTCSPKQLATAPPKCVVASPNLLLSLATQKQSPNQNVIRLAVKNGKLVPDMSVPTPSLVMSSKKVVVPEPPAPAPKPIQSQQQVMLSAPKPQMNLSTVSSIVPITDAKFKANALSLKMNILSSLLHKNGNDAVKFPKKNADPSELLSAVGLGNKNSKPSTNSNELTEESKSKLIPVETPANSGLMSSNSTLTSNAVSIATGVLPLTTLSSDTTTTSAVLSAISSSTVPVTAIPESKPSQSGHVPIALKASPSASTAPLDIYANSVTTIATNSPESGLSPMDISESFSTPSVASVLAAPPDSKLVPSPVTTSETILPPSYHIASIEDSLITTVLPTATTSASLTPASTVDNFVIQPTTSVPDESDSSIPVICITLENTGKIQNDSKDVAEKATKPTSAGESNEETLLNTEKNIGAVVEVEKNQTSLSNMSVEPPSNVDPKELLNWTDLGIGPLAGSSITFRLNEFGMMEIDDNYDMNLDDLESGDVASCKDKNVDDSRVNKENFNDFLLCKENVIEENENSKENINLNTTVKKNKRKEAKHEIRIDALDPLEEEFKKTFEDKFDEIFNEKVESYKKAKLEGENRKSSNKHKDEHPVDVKEEIYQCKSCNCYGLSNEFYTERSCSVDCERDFKQKFVMARKREFELCDMKRKKKEKYYSLLKKEIQEQKISAKDDIKCKLEQIEKMEVEDDKMDLASIENEPSSSCSSQIPSQVKSEDIIDANDDSNLEVLSVGSDKSSSKSFPQPPSEPLSLPPSEPPSEPPSKPPSQPPSKPPSEPPSLPSSKPPSLPPSAPPSLPLPEPPSSIAAPFELFKCSETLKFETYQNANKIANPFRVGMKLEGIDPQHQSNFCVMTVADTKGYRIRLHFDGYNECHDFWVNANSPNIFPVGWCETRKRKLNPPLGYSKETFNWPSYLKQCRAKAAGSSLFRLPLNKVSSHFRKGMKIEAVDRKNSSLVCVATIADTIDNRVLVHFDSWGDVYDYWTDMSAPYIHPVGWCQENNHDLTPPTTYKSNKVFVWDEYLKETKSTAVPARAFKPKHNMFKVNMKLEAVDFRVPFLIRPATVIDIKDHQLKIAYDGLPETYAYWIDCDEVNIYPMEWCQKTRHPLEPPVSMKEVGECGVKGCKGFGHVKGLMYARHFSAMFCPYSKQNLDLDALESHIPDRLQAQPDTIEVDEPIGKPSVVRKDLLDTAGATSKALPSERLSPIPEKMHKFSIDSSSNRDFSSTKPQEVGRRKGRKRKHSKEMESMGDSLDVLRQEIIESVLRPGYMPSGNDSHAWTKHAAQLGINVIEADPRRWTHKQVTAFVTRIYNQPVKTQVFSEQEIDGEAFLMLTQKDLVDILGFKLGPAIKIFNTIVLLRQKIS